MKDKSEIIQTHLDLFKNGFERVVRGTTEKIGENLDLIRVMQEYDNALLE